MSGCENTSGHLTAGLSCAIGSADIDVRLGRPKQFYSPQGEPVYPILLPVEIKDTPFGPMEILKNPLKPDDEFWKPAPGNPFFPNDVIFPVKRNNGGGRWECLEAPGTNISVTYSYYESIDYAQLNFVMPSSFNWDNFDWSEFQLDGGGSTNANPFVSVAGSLSEVLRFAGRVGIRTIEDPQFSGFSVEIFPEYSMAIVVDSSGATVEQIALTDWQVTAQ